MEFGPPERCCASWRSPSLLGGNGVGSGMHQRSYSNHLKILTFAVGRYGPLRITSNTCGRNTAMSRRLHGENGAEKPLSRTKGAGDTFETR
eukprot:3498733-Amphidinium_carterae.1